MNIFFLDKDPAKAAEYLSDKHINKMLVESAQMLSTAVSLLYRFGEAKEFTTLYSPTHENHPCSKWLRESYDNFNWLVQHSIAINSEIIKRFGNKNHKSYQVIEEIYSIEPHKLFKFEKISSGLTPPPLVMPDRFILNPPEPTDSIIDKEDAERLNIYNAVRCYRNYYANGKQNLLDYSRSTTPEWIAQYQKAYGEKLNSNPKET